MKKKTLKDDIKRELLRELVNEIRQEKLKIPNLKLLRNNKGRVKPGMMFNSQFSFFLNFEDKQEWLRICRKELMVSGGEFLRDKIRELIKDAGVKAKDRADK